MVAAEPVEIRERRRAALRELVGVIAFQIVPARTSFDTTFASTHDERGLYFDRHIAPEVRDGQDVFATFDDCRDERTPEERLNPAEIDRSYAGNLACLTQVNFAPHE